MVDVKESREVWLERVLEARPCHGADVVRTWFERAPDELTWRELVVGAAEVVPVADQVWLAFVVAPSSVSAHVVRNAVNRAVGYAANAMDAAGVPHELRDMGPDADYARIKKVAYTAARAATTDAARAAAYAVCAAATDAARAATDAAYAAARAAYAATDAACAARAATDAAWEDEREAQLADF